MSRLPLVVSGALAGAVCALGVAPPAVASNGGAPGLVAGAMVSVTAPFSLSSSDVAYGPDTPNKVVKQHLREESNHPSYSALATVGWDSCSTIEWRLNPKGMPKSEFALVEKAIDKIEKPTELRYEYVGTTSHVPFVDDWEDVPDNADLFMGFAKAGSGSGQVPGLAGSPIGLGGYSQLGDSFDKGQAVFERKALKLKKKERLSLYMHEIGHTLGLDHSRSKRDIMYPSILGITNWGAGSELRILKRVGSLNRPCSLESPIPVAEEDLSLSIVGDRVVASWSHNPEGVVDPAGGGVAETVAYFVRVESLKSDAMVMRVEVPSGSGTRTVSADVGPVSEFATEFEDDGSPVDPWGSIMVYPSGTNSQPDERVWYEWDTAEVTLD